MQTPVTSRRGRRAVAGFGVARVDHRSGSVRIRFRHAGPHRPSQCRRVGVQDRTGATAAKAGSVTFAITNKGTIPHEFVVFKSDLAVDKLPMLADGTAVDEEGAGLTSVDEVEDIAVGATPTLTVTLPAGHYIVICNLPGHYQSGMHAAFTTN